MTKPKSKIGFYYHYKHDPKGPFNNYSYEVVGLGRNTEEKTFSVLYRPLYKSSWMPPADFQLRPLDNFIEKVKKDGKIFPRFKQIKDKKLIQKLIKIRNEMY